MTMRTCVHFTLLPQVLTEAIRSAQKDIYLAVCWFTIPELFEELLLKQRQGVNIHFILNFDQLNFSPTGLPFRRLIEAKAKGFGYTGHGLLHHKFVVIDKIRVLSGSYNWTRSRHNDSLIDFEDPVIAESFLIEWQRVRAQSQSLEVLDGRNARPISITHLFQPQFFNAHDIRRHVVRGNNIWLAQWGLKQSAKWSYCLKYQIWHLPVCQSICQKAVDKIGEWTRNCLIAYATTLDMPPRGSGFSQAKLFCKQLQVGDIVLGVDSSLVVGIGLIMSEPLYDEHRGLHCAVEWQVIENPKVLTGYKIPSKPISRLVGGGLAVIDAIMRDTA